MNRDRRVALTLAAALVLSGCGGVLFSYAEYCEEYVDCLDGSEADERACAIDLNEAEKLARVYDCLNDFGDYMACMKEEASCESMGRVDYWTSEGDCDDEYADYLDCLADESELMAEASVDTGQWGGSNSGYGSGGYGSGGYGSDSSGSGGNTGSGGDSFRDSCSLGSMICIEPNELDNIAWCLGVSGTYQANDCPSDHQGSCALPAGGDYTTEATAYYYDGFDGENACTGAGGTYTAS